MSFTNKKDTIAAVSSATGGAIAVIRVSGPSAFKVCLKIWRGKLSLPVASSDFGKMFLGKCIFGNGIPEENAYVVFFKAPKSYTGENTAEIYCHGGNAIVARILSSILKNGARQAAPGEFTYRAFINGKMDLSQAEAVAEIITAKTDIALNIAERQLEGAIREEISLLEKGLLNLLSFCETMLDFADENEINQDYDVIGKAKSIRKKIAFLIQTSESGIIIREGITIVIAGHPNAGKSSLFNLLTGKDRAIVTDIPGTTRDTIEEDAQIEGIYVRLIDTAGIREADDLIERLGIERSRKSIAHADIVLWILDLASPHEEQLKEIKKHTSEKINTIAVWNKLDLFPSKKKEKIQDGTVHNLMISVKKNIGITDLKNTIKKIVWGDNKNKDIPAFAINLRHRSLLEKTLENLDSAESHVAAQEWELAALFLRQAISSLKEITGENVSLDVLDIIFSKFCIGK